MQDEIPYEPPGMDEYLAEKARKNAAWLRKRGLLPETAQTESAQADSVQRVVSCCWASDQGRCSEPAVVEAYSTLSREWYPLCEAHRVNIIAPLRKISQTEAAANDKLRHSAPAEDSNNTKNV